MATGQEKYLCSISKTIGTVINKVTNDRNLGKNMATKYLVDLALAEPNFPISISNNSPTVGCSMQTEKGFFETTLSYRIEHDLPRQKSTFLRDAVLRGASIYKERDKKK